jgi:hypothetical protein
MSEETTADIVAEAERVIGAAARAKVPVRLIGGLAIKLHTPHLPAALRREYQDIDLVTTRKGGRDTVKLLEQLGYTPNERFNAMNAGRRAVVYDLAHQRQIDVFVGEFDMCHKLDLGARLELDEHTVPLAELLLTKLQIVRLNRKDLVDIAALVHGHDVGEHDSDTINRAHIARLLSADWGLWRTSKGTIESAIKHLPSLTLEDGDERLIRQRLERLWEAIDAAPKSLKWRSRAKIGERTRWYEEPEEIDHDRTGERL